MYVRLRFLTSLATLLCLLAMRAFYGTVKTWMT
jgi:hypothetical protein